MTGTLAGVLIPKDLGFNPSFESDRVNDTPTPTPRELEILKVLWEQGPSSVRAVYRRLAQAEDLAYNTVQTLLRIMEDKGLVDHHTEGRTFVYTPRFSRDESAARAEFDELVLSLLRSERISTAELERMHTMIQQARQKKTARRSARANGERT